MRILVAMSALVLLGPPTSTVGQTEVFFSPGGGCTSALISLIGKAKASVRVQAYSFTSRPILAALRTAQRRGVLVEVLLDRTHLQVKRSVAPRLLEWDVPVWIDEEHQIAHNKILIVDGQAVATGSFNYSDQAEDHNAENLVVIRDPQVAMKYGCNWELHRNHATMLTWNMLDVEPKDEEEEEEPWE